MSKAIIAAALVILTAAPALPQDASTVEGADPEAAKIVADCSARKFETAIEIKKDGKKRLTKMKLCAAKGADDAAWVKTLEDSKAKIAAHPDISAESKASIANQLDVEIAKYAGVNEASPTPVVAQQTPPVSTMEAPPAPPPPAPTATLASTPPSVAKQAAKKPRLTIRCLAPGESGPGSNCTSLNRATRLQIRADADLDPGASLRFLRRGDQRGEIAIAQMRQGELYRTKLPPELCAGVASSKVEIQVMGSNQPVETLGPLTLRC